LALLTSDVTRYLRKPVDFQEFLEAMRHLGLYWLLLNQAPPQSA